MEKEIYALAFDIGTTGVKTCLFKITDRIELIESASEGYNLYVMSDGGAEQDPDEWWQAMCSTSKKVIKNSKLDPKKIYGISFCSQMQGVVLVDKDGQYVHRAFSYMDQRASNQLKKWLAYGPQIAGANVPKLLKCLQVTGAVPASVKDPVWKYKWVEENEPENFKRVYKWLDVKEYLVCRMTGEFVMTRDSAFSTMLYDIRKGKQCWSPEICKLFDVNMNHLARIIECTDKAGTLRPEQAEELGLVPGIPVFGGGGDATLIGVGAGATELGDTHIYQGTSGWVSTVVDKSVVDANAMIAAIVGAENGKFNYFAELETAGKCVEWVKDHLALDDIDIYLHKQHDLNFKKADREAVYTNLYDYMMAVVDSIPAGAGGVIFTPWLHGNRCPFEDSNSRGMFFNISLETGKTEMIRAVVEGVCMHIRWMLEAEEKKVKGSNPVRFVGGGALSPVTSQILADVTGRTVETVDSPQNVGAVGAAVLIAVSAGLVKSVGESKKLISVTNTYKPDMKNKSVYDKNFEIFKQLYKANKDNFKALNSNS